MLIINKYMDPEAEKQKGSKQEDSKKMNMGEDDEREVNSGNLASELNSMSGTTKE